METINLSRPINYRSLIKLTVLLFAALFSFFCFQYQLIHPVCCDALDYISIGQLYAKHGFTNHATSHIRLYGYPLFIALNVKLSDLLLIKLDYLVYLVQTGLYVLGVFLLSRQVASIFSSTAANCCFFALLSNFFVYPYLAISLTDGLTVILLLFISYIILILFSAPFPLSLNRKNFLLSSILGFLMGFAIVVRPANINWLLLLPPVSLTWLIRCRKNMYTRMGHILAVCIGFGLAVAPQLLLNWEGFHQWTFLPTFKLGDYQLFSGNRMIKYATSMVSGGGSLIYNNPTTYILDADITTWYIHHPFIAIKTILVHFFAAFDFDYLFPYIYNYVPKYSWALFIFSHLVLFWSGVGYILAIQSARHNTLINPQFKTIQRLLLVLYPCLILGWITVYGLSAVENRFALPVFSAMLILATWALFIKARTISCKYWLYGLFISYLILAWQLSHWIADTKVIKV